MKVNIIGAGLAGSEASYQLAKNGIEVNLFEMRPKKFTPAHKTEKFAELVCSNSLRSDDETHPAGILKKELEELDSLLIKVAREYAIPGGRSLVVDREKFSNKITEILKSHPKINVINKEVKSISEINGITIIATGPLTSEALLNDLKEITGNDNLYFFDAISPIVEADSIDMNHAFYGSRYENRDDFINCPLTEEEYFKFINELKKAKTFPLREFEKEIHFEGCMPIEEMAKRGDLTLAYGPMKPVGLIDPKTGKMPFSVVQLRKENKEGTAYNIVGFQTKMLISEQERVFRLIPCLKNAKFLRYGSMHKNIYINSPLVLNDDMSLKNRKDVFIAGQLSGVEGYIESIAHGLLVSLIVLFKIKGKEFPFPENSFAIGSLYRFLREEKENFQPSNINFGLFKYPKEFRKIKNIKLKRKKIAEFSWKNFQSWKEKLTKS